MDKCLQCSKSASTDSITCAYCSNIIHMLCLFDANIIDVQNNNKIIIIKLNHQLIMQNLYLIVIILLLNAIHVYHIQLLLIHLIQLYHNYLILMKNWMILKN